jgi:hypothetical protein
MNDTTKVAAVTAKGFVPPVHQDEVTDLVAHDVVVINVTDAAYRTVHLTQPCLICNGNHPSFMHRVSEMGVGPVSFALTLVLVLVFGIALIRAAVSQPSKGA